MSKRLMTASFLVISSGALAFAACGPPTPRSTTTTSTKMSTEDVSGEKTQSDVTVVKTTQPDGSQTTNTTQTTQHTEPAPAPVPAPAH
jgi:hypothetical protein